MPCAHEGAPVMDHCTGLQRAPELHVHATDVPPAQVGEERSIVSAMSGTTRDAVDTELSLPDGRRFTLIDTAGIRKRTAVASSADGAEPLSVNRALQAIRWVARQCLSCKDVQLVSSGQPYCVVTGSHHLD